MIVGDMYLVLANDDFFDQFAVAKLDQIGSFKRAGDLSSGDERKTFNTFEVRVFDDKNAFLGEQRFGIVVNQLTIHEAVDAVGSNGVDFSFHFFLYHWLATRTKNRIMTYPLGPL